MGIARSVALLCEKDQIGLALQNIADRSLLRLFDPVPFYHHLALLLGRPIP